MSKNPNAEMQDGLSDATAELSLSWIRDVLCVVPRNLADV